MLKDGCLKFENIYNLYMRCFKGRYLYIVTDCCYSGAWVEECAKLLDRDDIKCGHDSKREKIYIKVFASCLPNEALDKFYTECGGSICTQLVIIGSLHLLSIESLNMKH